MITAAKTTFVSAQDRTSPHPNIIECELSFADDAAKNGLKYAFEHNLDSAGMLVSGIHFINGLKAYEKVKTDTNELLSWKPVYAVLNKDKDFGFTTGPYLYFRRKNEAAVLSGNYFSIWKKNKEKILKLIFDGGVIHKSVSEVHLMAMKNIKPVITQFKTTANPDNIGPPPLSNTKAVDSFMDKKALRLRAGKGVLESIGGKFKDEVMYALIQKGEGYDNSGHFYYCFGNLSNQKKGTESVPFSGFYVQVWKFDKKWKIVAEVIQLVS